MCKPTPKEIDRAVATQLPSRAAPTTLDKEEEPVMEESQRQQKILKDGVMYGTVSLAALVLANAVTMGHYQNRLSELGCDSLCVGSMTSARSTLTLLGSTVIGMVSDSSSPIWGTFGGARKACMILGVFASALSVAIASTATDLTTIWASMVPSSLFQQNFSILKALFGDYQPASATSAERAGSVGMLGMAAGLAFMVGPLMGATLLKSYEHATMFSFVCLLVSVAVIVFLLPSPANSNDSEEAMPASDEKSQEEGASTQSMFRKFLPDLVPAARTPPAIFLMASRFCMGLAFHIFQTIWTVALKTRFQFGPKQYGQYFGFIGLTFALSQGFAAKLLLKHFGKTTQQRTRLLLACCCLLGAGRLFVYYASSMWIVYAVYGPIVMALGVVNTIFTADTSNIASPQELGGLFGILASVESLAGIVGPILGGLLAKVDPEQAPLTAVVGLYGVVFALIYTKYEEVVANPRTKGDVPKNENESSVSEGDMKEASSKKDD